LFLGVEAHGGYSFCGFAALVLLGEEDKIDIKRLLVSFASDGEKMHWSFKFLYLLSKSLILIEMDKPKTNEARGRISGSKTWRVLVCLLGSGWWSTS
jgi:protein farnesyltransferase subunit beta